MTTAAFGAFFLLGAVGSAISPPPARTPAAATTTAAPAEVAPPTTTVERPAKPAPPPRATPKEVPIKALLAEYKNNEVRADGLYKGKLVQVTGIVGDVKKGPFGGLYVTLGTGALLEIPMVQATGFRDESGLSALNKGARATVRGRVDGLMMNVLLKDAELVP